MRLHPIIPSLSQHPAMTNPTVRFDRTSQLQRLMQSVGFSSFKSLSQATGISERQLLRLRRGELAGMRLATLIKLSQALQVSVTDLLEQFGDLTPRGETDGAGRELPASQHDATSPSDLQDLQREYDRLQTQLQQQQQALQQEFQQTSLQILESLLLQLPTAMYAAQQNPQAPAVKLLPLLRPLETLLQAWGIEQIAPVGAEVPYDPQQHQLMAGTAEIGDRVRIRYTGYRQGERLLYRAKVSGV